jgi:hypothetical protein
MHSSTPISSRPSIIAINLLSLAHVRRTRILIYLHLPAGACSPNKVENFAGFGITLKSGIPTCMVETVHDSLQYVERRQSSNAAAIKDSRQSPVWSTGLVPPPIDCVLVGSISMIRTILIIEVYAYPGSLVST